MQFEKRINKNSREPDKLPEHRVERRRRPSCRPPTAHCQLSKPETLNTKIYHKLQRHWPRQTTIQKDNQSTEHSHGKTNRRPSKEPQLTSETHEPDTQTVIQYQTTTFSKKPSKIQQSIVIYRQLSQRRSRASERDHRAAKTTE